MVNSLCFAAANRGSHASSSNTMRRNNFSSSESVSFSFRIQINSDMVQIYELPSLGYSS